MKISVISPSLRPQGLESVRESLLNQSLKDFEWLVEINYTGKHDLNSAFNKMIKRAEGELIVFYEDYTRITPEGLKKFWRAYQDNPNTLFTAPLGKVDEWGEQPRWDWRSYKQDESQDKYTDCAWNCCELDWGAVPKKILEDIGGFDERLDQWWSFDNVSMGKRAQLLGYKFKCVFDNPAVAIDHDKIIEHPFRKDFNPPEVNKILAEYETNPRLTYL